jgi:hypothetical protein
MIEYLDAAIETLGDVTATGANLVRLNRAYEFLLTLRGQMAQGPRL